MDLALQCAPKNEARNILAAQSVALVTLKTKRPLGKAGFAQCAENRLDIPAVAEMPARAGDTIVMLTSKGISANTAS